VALTFSAATVAGIAVAGGRGLTTVRLFLPPGLGCVIDTLQVTAVERPTTRPEAPVGSGALMTLSTAVQAREVLRFDYVSAARPVREDPPRRVQPHHLVSWDGRWYLLAWDLDRDDWRVFRADKITPRTPTGPRFTPREVPGGDVAAFVTSRFRGSDGVGDWPCRGQVILDLPAPMVSPYVRDGVVEELGPDCCRLVLGSWSWPGLATAIGRFDADIEVIGPPELKAAFAHLARRYAEAATGEPTGPTGDMHVARESGE
ncbi:helix-turn-helix transcriptional regulator, partial [Nocardia abscessus]|uniref:helix-turn-helix transcriptional regulator n=1 Tax=Nocardia abscessus TaxID=120957 RepID=UPI0024564AD6